MRITQDNDRRPPPTDAGIGGGPGAFAHVGPDGPILLQDFYLIEQMANFKREPFPHGDIRRQSHTFPAVTACASHGPASGCPAGGVRRTAQCGGRLETVVPAEVAASSRQALYDAVAAFTDNGLVRCIQRVGSPACYDDRAGDNCHLICRTCSRMVDVDGAVGDTVSDGRRRLGLRDGRSRRRLTGARCPEWLAATLVSSDG